MKCWQCPIDCRFVCDRDVRAKRQMHATTYAHTIDHFVVCFFFALLSCSIFSRFVLLSITTIRNNLYHRRCAFYLSSLVEIVWRLFFCFVALRVFEVSEYLGIARAHAQTPNSMWICSVPLDPSVLDFCFARLALIAVRQRNIMKATIPKWLCRVVKCVYVR